MSKKTQTAAGSHAIVVAETAKALSPVEALFIQRALSADRVREALEALVPDGTEADIDVTVRVRGHLKRGESGDRKPTSRALRKATLAVLVRRMGLQREKALELISSVLLEAHELTEDAEKKLLEEHPEVEEAFGKVDAFIDTLPRIPTQGRVGVTDVLVERVLRAEED
jgi:hypothetical protein